jgi:hypothetical protein
MSDAARYDRYHKGLVPGWVQVILWVAVVGLVAGLILHRSTLPPGDLERMVAFVAPVAMALVLLLVRVDLD